MTTFVCIPGAGGAAWCFSRLVPVLEQSGHRAIAVDLPAADESAGLADYAELVGQIIDKADTAETAEDPVLVAASLGAFTAAMVAAQRPVRAIVLVNAMIPVPGEKPADWWDAVDVSPARIAAAQRGGYSTDVDLDTYFLHDVDPAVAAESQFHDQPEAEAAFQSVCSFERWPDIPIRVLAGADDRFFPADFQRRLAKERLGVEADVLPGGHVMMLSNAPAMADYLLAVAP